VKLKGIDRGPHRNIAEELMECLKGGKHG